jgi:hypothetical protein
VNSQTWHLEVTKSDERTTLYAVKDDGSKELSASVKGPCGKRALAAMLQQLAHKLDWDED